jgi:hypothetical protein
VVECTALEMRRAGNGTEGSNPSLSASNLLVDQTLCRLRMGDRRGINDLLTFVVATLR